MIGVSDYTNGWPKLPGVKTDSQAVSAALKQHGFSITQVNNPKDRRALEEAFTSFIDKYGLKKENRLLFYFSGHGIQVSGRNYLIPVKYTITSEDDVEYESVDAGRVLAKMKAARNGMNIVILDACRNNPFPSSFRSASQGLATINAPSGTFISYATAPGSVASDGSGNIGLYTGELIRHMKSPGLKLEEVFKKVRTDVQKKSSDKQVPWDASSLTGDFYFVPPTETTGDANLENERQKIADEKRKLNEERQKLNAQKEAELRYERQKLAEEKRKVTAERRRIDADDIAILADIQKKHSSHALTSDLAIGDHARGADFMGADGVILTGSHTGHAVDVAQLREVRGATELPLLVGSGVTPENIKEILNGGRLLLALEI